MPPKAKSKTGIVGEYDVEIMNDDELKLYIDALKEESLRMRAAFNTHQQNKRELTILLTNTQEETFKKHEELIQKEIKLQQLLSESNDKLKAEEERKLIAELRTNEAREKGELAISTEVITAAAIHRDAERKLKVSLENIERELEKSRLAERFLEMDLKEKKEEQHANLTETTENALNNISEEYIQKFRNTIQTFYSSKINTLNESWNEITNKNICEDSLSEHAEKMSLYFKELFWKNTKASATLKNRVENLEKELSKLNVQLKSVERENKSLLEKVGLQEVKPNDDTLSHPQLIDTNDTELQEVVYENDVLKEKLRQVTIERDNLRSRFISALRKICQKADFSYFLAEELLCHIENSPIKGPAVLTSETVTSSADSTYELNDTEFSTYGNEIR